MIALRKENPNVNSLRRSTWREISIPNYQFLGKLMFPFNRIMPIHGGPLDHHSHTSHVKFLTLATIEFKTIKNIQLNLNQDDAL